MSKLKNLTLELSLKPFKSMEDAFIKTLCIDLFRHWYSLIKHADGISILLWGGDGTELLAACRT